MAYQRATFARAARLLTFFTAAGAFAIVGGSAQALADAPFDGLSGNWKGEGSIALTSGKTERLHCEANYVVSDGGAHATQSVRCNSDSYKFDLLDELTSSDGAILGTWSERVNQVDGGISGRASKGSIEVRVKGQTFAATVSVTTRGSEQSFQIRADSGDLSRVSISLHHVH